MQLGLHVKAVPVAYEKLHKRNGGEPVFVRDSDASAVRSAASSESGAKRLDSASSSANGLFVKADFNLISNCGLNPMNSIGFNWF